MSTDRAKSLLTRMVNSYVRGVVADFLSEAKGNVTLAAKNAGRNRTEFYRLINKCGIKPAEYR